MSELTQKHAFECYIKECSPEKSGIARLTSNRGISRRAGGAPAVVTPRSVGAHGGDAALSVGAECLRTLVDIWANWDHMRAEWTSFSTQVKHGTF